MRALDGHAGSLDRSLRRAVIGAAVLVAGGLIALPRPAAALEPVPGPATVDGSMAEWGPADDLAALVGNDPPHVERGRLSLRYDCDQEVLYALLVAGPGLRLRADDADEAYLRFGSEPKLVSGTDRADGDGPDAAWVDPSDGTAAAIEMSTALAPGNHSDLRVHAKIPNDSADGYETVDLLPRYVELDVDCGPAEVANLSLATGQADDPAPEPAEAAGLARTGAPVIPVLVTAGAVLVATGAALRLRRWGRPALR